MKLKTLYFTFLSLGLCVILSVQPILAHTTSQTNIIKTTYIEDFQRFCPGSEDIGWILKEHCHIGSVDSFSYQRSSKHGISMDTRLSWEVTYGAASWAPTAFISANTITNNQIYLTNTLPNEYVAAFCCYHNDSNGDHVHWDIMLNELYKDSINRTTIAHELGHVIGLADLYEASNINKLMYNAGDRTTSVPTTSDIWGAKIITGQHSTHTWTSDPYTNHTCTDCGGYGTHNPHGPYRKAGPLYHSYICTSCSQLAYQAHIWDPLTGKCAQCGYTGEVTIFSVK